MKIKTRLIAIILTAISLLAVLSVFATYKTMQISSFSPRKTVVVIDAGHGGIDGGASGTVTGVRECDLNLLIAKKLQEKFAVLGIKTVMTRQDDNGLYDTTEPGFKLRDLSKRVEIVNGSGASAVISIHQNVYSSKKRRGAQTFYKGDSKGGKALANFIQNELNVAKNSPRILSALSGDYYLLNESNPPAVIVECGYLSSPEDEKILLTEEYRESLVNAIANGTIKFLTKK